ncbi:MAG: hypothetical protein Q9160_004114 [Pyrenula sp. 1 TL-2023]
MANVHNLFLRMLNSIYLQCEHVHDSKDVMDFLFYCSCWSRTMHHHHQEEEEELFPAIEKAIGRPGSMESNVQQHDAFLGGLGDFFEYTKRCQEEGGKSYDGKKVKAFIDSFGKPLELHMHEEIDSLLEARKYDLDGEKLKGFFLSFENKVQATLDNTSGRVEILLKRFPRKNSAAAVRVLSIYKQRAVVVRGTPQSTSESHLREPFWLPLMTGNFSAGKAMV